MNRLKEARFKKKISQFKLSLKTGIWQSRISFIENDRWNPSEKEKNKLAKVLSVEADWLFPEKK